MQPQPPPILPKLRADLRLLPGSPDGRGGQDWLIYDPVRHRYFQIDAFTASLLARWDDIDLPSFVARGQTELDETLTEETVQSLIKFLIANNLTLAPAGGHGTAYADQVMAQKRSLGARVVHNYLFFKVPLFRPQAVLEATYWLVAPLYTRTAAIVIAILSLAGLYLASRQWEAFQQTFMDFISLQGAVAFAASLIFVKSMHELGHAYTATRYGVRVNTMGIAFMLAMPILYTDVTDAWRLKSRKQKLAIAGAGMAVELAIAGIATLLWVFLAPGPLRSVAFVLATTSWILSLAVNLNPFMRFDGYYLLSDGWNIPNLQTRAFAMARWAVREILFDLQDPPPENFPRSTRRWMVIYAWGTWIYRLLLFIGIALLVYHALFKVLGVILFVVEILWFIVIPIAKEVMEWWKMRGRIGFRFRTLATFSILALLLAGFVTPWSSSVRSPALLAYENEFRIFAPRAAQITNIALTEGAERREGQTLLRLNSDSIRHKIEVVRLRISSREVRLSRIAADAQDRAARTILQTEIEAARHELAGLQLEAKRLEISAPFSGYLRDVQPALAVGDWLNGAKPLATLVDPSSVSIFGYVHEDDIWRINRGATARFIAEDPVQSAVSGRVVEIAKTGSKRIDLNYLASIYGGAIPTDKNDKGEIIPRAGWYFVHIETQATKLPATQRGTLHIEASPESFAAMAWRRILQVLVREAGV